MFYCDTIQCEVKKPCSLRSCKFNIKQPYSLNCLKYYTATKGTPSMGEVAYFYDMPIDRLRELYGTSVDKIYKNVIKEKIGTVDIHYIPTNKVCVECESLVFDPVVVGQNVICKECCKYNPKIWLKAIDYNTTPDELMKICFELFKNNTMIDRFLTVPRGTAKRIKERE